MLVVIPLKYSIQDTMKVYQIKAEGSCVILFLVLGQLLLHHLLAFLLLT